MTDAEDSLAVLSPDETVFDSRFLRRLERLCLRVTRVFKSAGRGDRRSRRKGDAPEFREHRIYQRGDDIRHIDWSVYARFEQLYLKQHGAEQDLVVHLFLDCSASMAIAHKFHFARRLAAAMSYIALASGDRVQIQPFASGQVQARYGPLRGRRCFPALLDYLKALEANGTTSLAEAVKRFCARSPKPGLVLFISDLLDLEGYETALKRLRYTHYEPVVLHTLTAAEMAPSLEADVDFECAESGDKMSVTLDRTAVRLYQEKLQAYLRALQTFCQKHGIAYILARDDESFESLFFQTMRSSKFFQS